MEHHLVAAFIVQGDRILLGLRSPDRQFYPQVWDVFGGHIEPDEQPDQTLVRELQEELNITPTKWEKLETIRDSIPAGEDMTHHELTAHLYCVTAWQGDPVNRQPHEHSVIQWFSYSEAIGLALAHPSYPKLFAQCLKRSPGENS